MARSPSPERRRELDSLYPVVLVFATFFDSHIPPAGGHTMREAVERAFAEHDLTGLRMVRDDDLAMVEACTPEQRRELDRRLRAEAGVTLDSLLTRRLARLERLRARGKITTEEQYYLAKERVEEVWDDPERSEEFQQLQAMLEDYEGRVVRRQRA